MHESQAGVIFVDLIYSFRWQRYDRQYVIMLERTMFRKGICVGMLKSRCHTWHRFAM